MARDTGIQAIIDAIDGISGGGGGDASLAEQQAQTALLTEIEADSIYLDPGNSSSALLGNGGVFTGTWFDAYRFPTIRVSYQASDPGSLYVDQRESASSPTVTTTYSAGASRVVAMPRQYRWVRIRYANGAIPQTHFALTTVFDPAPLTSVSITATDTELTPPQTLADNLANFTVPVVGAAALYWTGSVWARSQIDAKLDTLITALQSTTFTRTAETQLTAPGSTTARTMTRGMARIIYTVANINTNVVIRAEGRMHSSEGWFNLSTGDITITANGTYAIFIEQFITEIRLTFVSESGGTAATIDVSTYV